MKKKTILISLALLLVLSLSAAIVGFSIYNNEKNIVFHTVSFNTNGGEPIESVKVKHGNKVEKPNDPVYLGHFVDKWIYNEKEWLFNVYEVNEDITLNASWDLQLYNINYFFEGGHYDSAYKTTYTIESDFELIQPLKDSFVFGGWFLESGQRIDKISKGQHGDLNLYARWYSNILVESSDPTRGNVFVIGEEDTEKVSLLSKPVNNKYHLFKGWYDENDEFLSLDNPYKVALKPQTVSKFFAKYMSDVEEDEWDLAHGVKPNTILDEKHNIDFITYGMYPQTVVSDDDMVDKLEQTQETEFLNYHYLDGEYYTKKKTHLYDKSFAYNTFDNGEDIVDGKEYWYKVEAITWKILRDNLDGTCKVFSNNLLTTTKYHNDLNSRVVDDQIIQPNNYYYSDIRSFLNDSLFDDLFPINDEHVISTLVDNSAKTTPDINSPYESQDSNDKLFLLSYKEYVSDDFSLSPSSNDSRMFKTTDFSRTSGAKFSDEKYGYCWTRSPIIEGDGGYYICKVNQSGTVNTESTVANYICVQPAMTIRMNIL